MAGVNDADNHTEGGQSRRGRSPGRQHSHIAHKQRVTEDGHRGSFDTPMWQLDDFRHYWVHENVLFVGLL